MYQAFIKAAVNKKMLINEIWRCLEELFSIIWHLVAKLVEI
jgi:hypothetical protein